MCFDHARRSPMAEHRNELPALISSDEIRNWAPYSLNHIRRLEASGDFPRRVRIGPNRVAWIRGEIDDWVEQRIAARAQK
jgi:prophage regulatory protein